MIPLHPADSISKCDCLSQIHVMFLCILRAELTGFDLPCQAGEGNHKKISFRPQVVNIANENQRLEG